MPTPTDDGKTYTFKIVDGVKFHDGSPLTAADVAASWNEIIFPPEGVLSPRASFYRMVDKVEAPDPQTVVFRLKFATNAFLPALADAFSLIYPKVKLDQDPHWFEKNIMGSGPFKFVRYEAGQSITGARNPDYFRKGLIANVHTVGGIVFPASPLAATKEELEQLVGYWPDIEKSRAEAKRLLKEAGAEGLTLSSSIATSTSPTNTSAPG